jgi:hypothetical protein
MQKTELLNALQEQYQQWQALLDQIGPERMEQPGVNGDWSMKDMVAHLTGWNRWLAIRLEAALLKEPKPLPPWPAQLDDEDEINAWIYDENRRRPLSDVLEDMQQAHQQVMGAIEDLPNDVRIERVDPAYFLVWVGDERFEVSEFFNHFRDDHEPDVHRWMAQAGISQERQGKA